jgi:Zn-dependent protease
MDILILVIGIAGFVLAIIIHEVAHGLVAERLGDPTARLMGRLTLNPIPHIDPIGSILLPITLLVLRSPFLFGWAKPVPVDPYNLQHPKKDMAIISLAGPLSNILFAGILSIFLRILLSIFPSTNIFGLFFYIIQFNVALAVFNLIPVNPLDGGKILAGILPEEKARSFNRFLNRYGMIVIFLLIFPTFGGSSLAMIIVGPIINFLLKILIPGYSLI